MAKSSKCSSGKCMGHPVDPHVHEKVHEAVERSLDLAFSRLSDLQEALKDVQGKLAAHLQNHAAETRELTKTVPLRPSVSGQLSDQEIDQAWEHGSIPRPIGTEINPRERFPDPRSTQARKPD